VQEEEVFSRTHIALTAPYRPKISHYNDEKKYKEGVTSSFDLCETTINYTNQKTFTGEDEKFAYRRALSPVKEMSSDRYKVQQWSLMRPWERTTSSPSSNPLVKKYINHASKPGPSFRDSHFWLMGVWRRGERINNMAKNGSKVLITKLDRLLLLVCKLYI
jgi:hypothetical protein